MAPATDALPGMGGDLYAVLGLEPRASREQVERAYRFHLELYGEGSLATYTLLDPTEAEQQRIRVHEAYEVLVDDERRRAYDEGQGFLAPDASVLPFPVRSSAIPVRELPAVLTGADLRKIREARGVSLRQIANLTKIGVQFLENLFVYVLIFPVVGLLIWRRLRNPGLRGGHLRPEDNGSTGTGTSGGASR